MKLDANRNITSRPTEEHKPLASRVSACSTIIPLVFFYATRVYYIINNITYHINNVASNLLCSPTYVTVPLSAAALS
jgi:hypothetical protein